MQTSPIASMHQLWLLLIPFMAAASWLLLQQPTVEMELFAPAPKDHNKDLIELEHFLSQLYITDGQGLVIATNSESSLAMAAKTWSQYELNTLEKSFPAKAGRQLLALAQCYSAYKQAELRVHQDYLAAHPDELPEQFIDYRPLQFLFFGSVAQALFAEHMQFYQNLPLDKTQLIIPKLSDVTPASVCTAIIKIDE